MIHYEWKKSITQKGGDRTKEDGLFDEASFSAPLIIERGAEQNAPSGQEVARALKGSEFVEVVVLQGGPSCSSC